MSKAWTVYGVRCTTFTAERAIIKNLRKRAIAYIGAGGDQARLHDWLGISRFHCRRLVHGLVSAGDLAWED